MPTDVPGEHHKHQLCALCPLGLLFSLVFLSRVQTVLISSECAHAHIVAFVLSLPGSIGFVILLAVCIAVFVRECDWPLTCQNDSGLTLADVLCSSSESEGIIDTQHSRFRQPALSAGGLLHRSYSCSVMCEAVAG